MLKMLLLNARSQRSCILVNSVLLILQTLAEPLLKEGQFRDEIRDGVHEGVIGCVVGGGLDSQHNRMLQRERILVASKQNIWVFQELLADHVADGVVLLVDGEYCRIGHLCALLPCDLLLPVIEQKGLKGGGSIHPDLLTGSSSLVEVNQAIK